MRRSDAEREITASLRLSYLRVALAPLYRRRDDHRDADDHRSDDDRKRGVVVFLDLFFYRERGDEDDYPKCDQKNDEADSDRSEEHTSELQSPCNLVCRLLLEKKKT